MQVRVPCAVTVPAGRRVAGHDGDLELREAVQVQRPADQPGAGPGGRAAGTGGPLPASPVLRPGGHGQAASAVTPEVRIAASRRPGRRRGRFGCPVIRDRCQKSPHRYLPMWVPG